MLIVNVLIILFFVALAVMFARGKGIDLIAGYNTMSASEKEKINKEALCKYMSRFMLVLAACWCVLSVGIQISQTWLFWVGFALFIGATIVFAIYLNTGNRIQKKD